MHGGMRADDRAFFPVPQAPGGTCQRRRTQRTSGGAATNTAGGIRKGRPSQHASPQYKTRHCTYWPLGSCRNGHLCPFAHGEEDLRPVPDLERTSMCPLLREGQCNQPRCRYAHTSDEIQVAPGLLKTRMCEFFLSDVCSAGEACRFAHSAEELWRATVEQRKALAATAREWGNGSSTSSRPSTWEQRRQMFLLSATPSSGSRQDASAIRPHVQDASAAAHPMDGTAGPAAQSAAAAAAAAEQHADASTSAAVSAGADTFAQGGSMPGYVLPAADLDAPPRFSVGCQRQLPQQHVEQQEVEVVTAAKRSTGASNRRSTPKAKMESFVSFADTGSIVDIEDLRQVVRPCCTSSSAPPLVDLRRRSRASLGETAKVPAVDGILRLQADDLHGCAMCCMGLGPLGEPCAACTCGLRVVARNTFLTCAEECEGLSALRRRIKSL